MAAALWEHAEIKNQLTAKRPDLSEHINNMVKLYGPAINTGDLKRYTDAVLWEVTDEIIYNKCPNVYDERPDFGWDFGEITSLVSLEDKIVIDAGAGTGRVAFAAAKSAKAVYAVEPVGALREFINDKAAELEITNIFVSNGFLHSIPFHDGFADVLITSRAFGWSPLTELAEMDRIVKNGGSIIHLSGIPDNINENPMDDLLYDDQWGYTCGRYKERDGFKLKYWKIR